MTNPEELDRLRRLQSAVAAAIKILESGRIVDCSDEEAQRFHSEHPGADFIIGDFEIKDLARQKPGPLDLDKMFRALYAIKRRRESQPGYNPDVLEF